MKTVVCLWAAMALCAFALCGCSEVAQEVGETIEQQKTQVIESSGDALGNALDEGQREITEEASDSLRGDEEEEEVRDELSGDEEEEGPSSEDRESN